MNPRDEDWENFLALPAGWSVGCRNEDVDWCDTYRNIGWPADIANPTDTVPPGYSAYTMIMASREQHNDDEPRPHDSWLPSGENEPWPALRALIDADPTGADMGMSVTDMDALLAELSLDASGLYSCGFFFNAHDLCTATGEALTSALLGSGYSWPTIWFPHNRAFVVSTPYDGPMTYVASNAELASRLRDNAALETYLCTYAAD